MIGTVDPGALVQVFIGFDDAPVEGQDERHGVIGDFVGAVVGTVADDDAVIGGGIEIDMVDTDRHASDGAAMCNCSMTERGTASREETTRESASLARARSSSGVSHHPGDQFDLDIGELRNRFDLIAEVVTIRGVDQTKRATPTFPNASFPVAPRQFRLRDYRTERGAQFDMQLLPF